MTRSAKLVLIDLTPLHTPTRYRGNGRYVREVCDGISALSSSERDGLDIMGLTRLELDGTYQVTHDLKGFCHQESRFKPTQRDHYRWAYARRFWLARAVKQIGADVVHIIDPNSTPLFARQSKARWLVTCHDAIPMRYPEKYFGVHDGGPRLGAWILKKRYRYADRVVAISNATRHDAMALLDIPEEKLVTIYNGVPIEHWDRELPSLPSELLERLEIRRPFFLYVGGYHWHKNIHGMFEALKLVRNQGPDVEIVWAGALSESTQQHVNLIAQTFGVERFIRFVGYQDDDALLTLYRAATGHIMVSFAEGFGYTVVEAMAAGCPVITTGGASLSEIAGEAGLGVDPGSVSSIANAMNQLHTSAELRATLINKGRAQAAQFSLERQARAVVELYREL